MIHSGAYDYPLAFGGNTVSLRPSLRAAMQIEKTQGGFPALLTKLQELDTATIKAVIMAAATDKQEATAFLSGMADQPLHQINTAFLSPVYALIKALMSPNRAPSTAQPTGGKPMEWADLYTDLYKIATGWLGWPPAHAWAATLIEITDAFDGHTAKLKAIHGDGTEDTTPTNPNTAQREANIAAGLDPDFDRAGLAALKARHTT